MTPNVITLNKQRYPAERKKKKDYTRHSVERERESERERERGREREREREICR